MLGLFPLGAGFLGQTSVVRAPAPAPDQVTYLGRPVFTFPINWTTQPTLDFSYDLNSLALGNSPLTYQPNQSHTIQGFEFAVLLGSEEEIIAYDTFTAQLRGRLAGFWIPSPSFEAEIVGGLTDSSFLIKDQGLRVSYQDHPALHLSFRRGEEIQFARISSVSLDAAGRERITLDSNLSPAVDATWRVCKLLYVRFGSDTERAEFAAENVQARTLRVVELPNEYAETETGLRPVYLYEFSLKLGVNSVYWRLTNLNEDIVSVGQTWLAKPIEHASHSMSMQSDHDELSIRSARGAWNPMTRFFPFVLQVPLWVRIYETTYAAPNSRTQIFGGKVEEVTVEGELLRAKCSSFLKVLGRKFPRMIMSPRCNYVVFTVPCGVNAAPFTSTVEISAINGRKVTVTGSGDPFVGAGANYFALGWFETGTGDTYEIRGIEASSMEAGGEITLKLTAPLSFVVVEQAAVIRAGCDGSNRTCDEKFSNFRRWGGHVMVPANPAIRTIETEPNSGGKK